MGGVGVLWRRPNTAEGNGRRGIRAQHGHGISSYPASCHTALMALCFPLAGSLPGTEGADGG